MLSHRSEISHLQSEIDKLSSVVASLRSSKSESSDRDSSNSMKDAASVKKKSRPQSQKVHSHSRPPAVDNSRSPIPVDNARKIWGTMKAASSKTVLTAVQRVAPNLNSLTVKRKFHVQNGTTRRWWHVVRGSKSDIDLLDSVWNKIQTQTGWKLQPLLSFLNTNSVAPTSTIHERSVALPTVSVNKGATSITNSLLPTTAPVLDLSEYVPVSPRVSPVTASSFASNTPSTCPTKTSPSLVHPQVPSTSVAKDPGIAVPPTSNPGTTLPSTSSSDS